MNDQVISRGLPIIDIGGAARTGVFLFAINQHCEYIIASWSKQKANLLIKCFATACTP